MLFGICDVLCSDPLYSDVPNLYLERHGPERSLLRRKDSCSMIIGIMPATVLVTNSGAGMRPGARCRRCHLCSLVEFEQPLQSFPFMLHV